MADGRALTTSEGGGNNLPPQLAPLAQFFGEQMLRKLALLVGLALAVAAGIALFMWAQEPAYRPLFSRLSDQDAPKVVDALQAASVQYRLESGNSILVPAADVDKVRLQLASQGLPQSGAGIGFESLQKEQGFGTSQFIENARFQRALETELARSIGTIHGVESARVHLAIPKQSVFIRERSGPTASVLVNLMSGRSLSDGQVAAIVHMVASSVPDLAGDKVTVVDQRGRLLTEQGQGTLGATTAQLEYKRQLEDGYVRRIESLLAPMVGNDRIRAQVNARLDFAMQESTQELFDPNGVAVRSEQTSEQQSVAGDQVAGVPGALTNQPPQAGTLAPGQTGAAGAEATSNLNRTATRNFEVTKTIRHTRTPVGQIERLSIAVLVDQKEVVDDEGNVSREPIPEAELNQIAGLVREAVGFDERRGDTISVISAAFKPAEVAAAPEVPFLERPSTLEWGKNLVFAVGALLLFLVVRRIVRGLVAAPVRAEPDRDSDQAQLEQLPEGEVPLLPGQQRPQLPGATGGLSYEDSITTARSVVAQDAAAAASVVKTWLAQDE